MSEWFEAAAFWDVMGPHMFDTKRADGTPAEVDGAVALLGVEPPAAVLDLCCGPGRHSVELAGRGYRVTGVDRHTPYLEQARAKSADVEWVESDMREFTRAGAFDAAINMYSSFGYFEDPGEDLRVLRNVHASLAPGGRFLIDTMSKEVLASKFEPRRWYRTEDGSIFLEEGEVLDNWNHIRTTWRLLKDGERHEFVLDLRLYAGTELKTLLEQAGFGDVRLHGWFDGSPYDNEAKRLVAVGTR